MPSEDLCLNFRRVSIHELGRFLKPVVRYAREEFMQKQVLGFFSFLCVLLSAITISAFCLAADAEGKSVPKLIKSGTGAWAPYVLDEGGKKVCYMASSPTESSGQYKARGKIYALLTHRSSEKTKDVFTFIAGYSYKEGSEANVVIDGKKFDLFTYNDTAWAPDAAIESKLASAIRDGSKMVVKGVSLRGNQTTDVFSLKGASAAYEAISKACGI